MDKYVHFTFHFVFTILWSYYFFVLYDKVNFKIVLGIVLLSFIYGVLIEILQETFTLTRHADVVDVIANSAGAITAFVFLMIVKNKTSYLS